MSFKDLTEFDFKKGKDKRTGFQIQVSEKFRDM